MGRSFVSFAKFIYHKVLKEKSDIKIRKKIRNTSNVLLNDELKDSYSYLYITNNHTGGTYLFEENFRQKSIEGLFVVQERYQDKEDVYCLKSQNKVIKFVTLDEFNVIFKKRYEKIYISTLVDFLNWKELLRKLIEYKKENISVELIYFVHDFHCICPNVNLFTVGSYCEGKMCEQLKCELSIGEEKVVISDWRGHWSGLLKMCDEIRCFSESSKKIIMSIYGMLDENKITVVPHDMSYCKNKPIENIQELPLHIGVVGVSHADFKGKRVVKQMIEKYGNDVPITLIGSEWWRYGIFKRKVHYLGRYHRDELEKLIRKSRVSCVLFPSLWPETFSYVVSEVIMLDVPVICFPYGAQEEKVSSYHKGIVCKDVEELWKYIDDRIVGQKI